MIETRHIKYVDGYKYQLREDFIFQSGIKPPYPIAAPLVTLRTDGMLIVGKYYAYDGPSGPTIDDATNMRGALVHDVFYYLMRMKFLDIKYREAADWLLKKCMIEDGAWPWRANYYHWAVRTFGGKYASPDGGRKILTAP